MKNWKTELKWAFIFIGMMLAWMGLERIAGLHDKHIDKHATYTLLVSVPAVLAYLFALIEKRQRDFNGIMTYKEGFLTGLKITVIIVVLSPVSQWVTTTFISPGFFPNMIAHAIATEKMTQEAAEAYFNLKNYMIQGSIGALIMGILTSAVVAAFTRKQSENS